MKCIKKHPVIAYTMIILSFSVIYYSVWRLNPDSFIKNNALNSTPVHDAVNLAFAYNEVKKEDPSGISYEEFTERTIMSTNEFNKIRINNLELEMKLSRKQDELKDIDKRLSLSWGENTNKYIAEKLRGVRKSLITKSKERSDILSSKNNLNESQINIMLADKDVEIAEINLQLATIDHDVHVYILSHIGDFNDAVITDELNAVNKEINNTRAQLINNEKRIIELRNNMQSMLQKLKKGDLNFCDFLFYSIGIATTTTFGDLLANSRVIRMIVCIQLLLSIVVLANVTQNFLSKK